MRLRTKNKGNQENSPVSCTEGSPTGGAFITGPSKSSAEKCSDTLRRRQILNERTNSNELVSGTHVRSKGKKVARQKSKGGFESVTFLGKELRILSTVSETPKKSVEAEDSGRDKNNGSVARRCVYMRAGEEKESSDKESVYEFHVDSTEPPSRRRRKPRRQKGGQRGYPRVRIPSARSETTSSCPSSPPAALSVSSCTAASRTLPPHQVELTSCSPSHVAVYPSTVRLRKRLAAVERSAPPLENTAPPEGLPEEVGGASDTTDHLRDGGAEGTPSKVPRASPVSLAPRKEDSVSVESLGMSVTSGNLCSTSLLGNDGVRGFLGFAEINYHSTPVKARSGTDTSSFLGHSQDATADNCFGFSTDEEEEEVGEMLSPVHNSPHTHALRHGYLSPPVVPSRFSPKVVQRALVMKALEFDQPKAKQAGRTKGKKRREKGAINKNPMGTSAGGDLARGGITKYLLKVEDSPRDAVEEVATPEVKRVLFGDAMEDEHQRDPPLSIRPPRRSYERPWNRKPKKVIGGGLFLDSGDEEEGGDEGRKEEERKAAAREVKACSKVHRRRPKAENKENQLDVWAQKVNSQFNEVDDFELCLE